MSSHEQVKSPCQRIGEVSIRVRDLDAMHKFYEEVVGLEVLPTGGCARREESFVFFKVGRASVLLWEILSLASVYTCAYNKGI